MAAAKVEEDIVEDVEDEGEYIILLMEVLKMELEIVLEEEEVIVVIDVGI